MWNLKVKNPVYGLKKGVKYQVMYHDSISFEVRGNRNISWIMTKQDIIDIFRVML